MGEEAPLHPWTDGALELDDHAAAAVIREAFPDLRGPVRSIGAGWDNVVFGVGEVAVRIAKRPLAAPLLESERRVLGALPALPLAIPRPLAFAPHTSTWPFPLLVCTLVPGRMLCDTDDHAVRVAAGRPLGRFLRALHDGPPPDGTPPDLLRRADLAHRLPIGLSRIAEIEAEDAEFPGADLRRVLLETVDATPWTGGPRLCHGDLYARHVVVDALGVRGVIDWGDVHRGDPAVDLAVAFHVVPPDGRAAFFEAYGPVDLQTQRRARFRAVFHLTAEWTYGLRAGAPDWRAEAARGAAWVLAEGADA